MDTTTSLIVIAFAALIHASFQLSVSVLTLLSGHSLGLNRSHAHITRMTSSFVIGSGIMTALLLSFVSLVLVNLFGFDAPKIIWAAGCGLLVGVAISVWLFYFRRSTGTTLWIPRAMAEYLTNRTKATKLSAEAFGLGLSSVIAEILFIIAPLFISSLVLITLPPSMQLIGIAMYTTISILPLITIWGIIGSGHKISHVQRWRESNKGFMQFSAGAGLVVLGIFVFVNEILANIPGVV